MITNIVDTLKQFARVAAGQAQPDRAARLWATAQAIEDTRDIDGTLGKHQHEAPNVAAIRAQLDEATFTSAWAEGRAMTLEQALAYALEGCEVAPSILLDLPHSAE